MSLRSRAPETSLALLIVFLAATTDGCGPVGKRVFQAVDAEPEPEGGTGGDSAGTGGSKGTGGSTGGAAGVEGGGTGGATGGCGLQPDASVSPPDTGSSATGGATGRMDAAPLPRDTLAPDLAPPPDTAPPSTLNNGLVSRWKLDEGSGNTARDAVTGTGDDGAVSGGTTWAQSGFPGAKYQNGGALTFDGTSGVADLSGKGVPALDAAMSIALWVNYSGAIPATSQPFIGFGASGAGRIKLGFNGGQLAAWKGASSTTLVSAAPPASGWHHLAYTFDGTTRRLYVDGAEKNSSTMAGETGAVAEGHIGSYGTQHFAGTLDEIRLYRRALTAGEVGQLAGGNE
jgi:hypothetical protein